MANGQGLAKAGEAGRRQGAMKRAGYEEKRQRSMQAYLDLCDAADWIRGRMKGLLEMFDLTYRGFRVVEILHRRGAMRTLEVAKQCQLSRQNVDGVIGRLAELGLARERVVALPAAEVKPSRVPIARRDRVRQGRKVAVLRLTPEGEKLMKKFIPRHAKVIKAFMRALDGRQQQSLSETCRALMKGDVLRFASELKWWREEELVDVQRDRSRLPSLPRIGTLGRLG